MIDCDVHVPAPAFAQLRPYLPEYWRGFLAEGGFSGFRAVADSYPPVLMGAMPADGAELVARLDALHPDGWDHAILNCFTSIESLQSEPLASALASAVNDWLVAEWLPADPRLLGSIVIPVQDPAGASAEMERLAANDRLVQVLLPVRSAAPYGKPRQLPIFAAAVAHDFVVALHYGGSPGAPSTPVGYPSFHVEEDAGMAHVFESQLISLVLEGTFARFPRLRLVLLEAGFTWLPPLLWRLDKDWRGNRREVPWVTEAPSEAIRRQVRVTTQPTDAPDRVQWLLQILEQIDRDDFLLFASDHPHPHQDGFARLREHFEPERLDAILSGNARAFYRLGEAADAR